MSLCFAAKPVPSPQDPELGLQVRQRPSPVILKRSVKGKGISLLLLRVGDLVGTRTRARSSLA